MHWREVQITRAVRKYDRELYARMGFEGRIDIFRRCFGFETYSLDGGIVIQKLKEEPYRVLALTDTWNAWGKPVDWGIEPIMAKLKACDLWQRNVAEETNAHNQKIDESQDRHLKSETEAYLKDNRRAMAKAWENVNTSGMDKRADRRFRDERKLKG